MALNFLKPKRTPDPVPDPLPAAQPRETSVHQGVSLEDFETLKHENAALKTEVESVKAYQQGFTRAQPQQQPPPQPRPQQKPLPSLDKRKLEEAVHQGDFGTVIDEINSLTSVYSQRIAGLERDTQVLGGALQGGVKVMAGVQRSIAKGQCPHYDRFRDEIESRLGQLGDGVAVQEGMVKFIHDQVVGENIDVLVNEAREEAIRKNTEDISAARPPNGRSFGGASYPEGIPPPEKLLGKDAVRWLKQEKGGSIDEYYRRMGYEGYADYVTQNKDHFGLDLEEDE